MYNILIVEDDETIAALLKENLIKWGFQADVIKDFTKVSDEVNTSNPHLVLLDISLPFYNGFYWCGEIRKKSKVPIIFLTSHTENMDIVMAMNMGGDDYITKPFSMEVVIVKIQALLRRAYDYYVETKTLEIQGVSLNLADNSLRANGKISDLTKNEFKIMRLLMENKNRIVLREEIMECLWDSECFVDDNTLTVNVNRLRKKLEDMELFEFIQTKKGLGYMIHD